MADATFKAEEMTIGYHPEGFRIDKTASPLDRYTQWTIQPDGHWSQPKAVCFHSLPLDGWIKCESFDWTDDPLN